jgi:hypothetical protein
MDTGTAGQNPVNRAKRWGHLARASPRALAHDSTCSSQILRWLDVTGIWSDDLEPAGAAHWHAHLTPLARRESDAAYGAGRGEWSVMSSAWDDRPGPSSLTSLRRIWSAQDPVSLAWQSPSEPQPATASDAASWLGIRWLMGSVGTTGVFEPAPCQEEGRGSESVCSTIPTRAGAQPLSCPQPEYSGLTPDAATPRSDMWFLPPPDRHSGRRDESRIRTRGENFVQSKSPKT